MGSLFDVSLNIKEDNSSKFIGRLKKAGFQRDNYNYVISYPGGNAAMYHNLKLLYDKEVVNGDDTIIEFLRNINALVEQSKLFSYKGYENVDLSESKTSDWMMEYYNRYIK